MHAQEQEGVSLERVKQEMDYTISQFHQDNQVELPLIHEGSAMRMLPLMLRNADQTVLYTLFLNVRRLEENKKVTVWIEQVTIRETFDKTPNPNPKTVQYFYGSHEIKSPEHISPLLAAYANLQKTEEYQALIKTPTWKKHHPNGAKDDSFFKDRPCSSLQAEGDALYKTPEYIALMKTPQYKELVNDQRIQDLLTISYYRASEKANEGIHKQNKKIRKQKELHKRELNDQAAFSKQESN